jgi:hypothetical protein
MNAPRKPLVVALALTLALAALHRFGRPLWVPAYYALAGKRTVDDVVAAYGPQARARLAPHLERAGVEGTPEWVTLIALKDEDRLELWVGPASAPTFVRAYPILAASGVAGPKLREGDRQVPEGIYAIESLNPNSSYHLSMRVNYPNAFDLEHAEAEGRDEPGSDIFVHGKDASLGCLAMGDPAIEELFVLAADVGHERVTLLIAPSDPRRAPLLPEGPAWVGELYARLTEAITAYPRPAE